MIYFILRFYSYIFKTPKKMSEYKYLYIKNELEVIGF